MTSRNFETPGLKGRNVSGSHPAGRPKIQRDLQELCRHWAFHRGAPTEKYPLGKPSGFERMLYLAEQEDDLRVAIRAAEVLLAYGVGRPPEKIEIEHKHEHAVRVGGLSGAELRGMLALVRKARASGGAPTGDVIEVEAMPPVGDKTHDVLVTDEDPLSLPAPAAVPPGGAATPGNRAAAVPELASADVRARGAEPVSPAAAVVPQQVLEDDLGL